MKFVSHSTHTAVLCLEWLAKVGLFRCLSCVAFDTLDHAILLKRLEITFGVRGRALDWLKFYLCSRKQSVIVDGIVSSPRPLENGVPHSSVLGPVPFTLYAKPLSSVIDAHGCDYHKYADDTELSKVLIPRSFSLPKLALGCALMICSPG